MSGAGRGVPPGAEPDAGSDEGAEAPAQAPDTAAQAPIAAGEQGQGGGSGTGPEAAGRAADQSAALGEDKSGTAKASPGSGAGAGGHRAAGKGKRKGKGKSGGRFLRELVILIAIALLIAVALKTYAIQAFFIPSGSMENTLEINDRVLVNKIVYHIRGIHRGDIVVFNGDGSWDPGSVPVHSNFVEEFFSGFASMFGFGHPGDILIKRVIGLPGDRVACCDAQGRLTVNGTPLSEQSYLYPGDVPSEDRFNIVVPSGRLWVMGDHRLISEDSRDHEGDPGGGTVPESAVVGRAFVIIWPPGRWRILPIPATFEQPKLNASAVATAAAGSAAATAGAGNANTPGLLSARLAPSSPALPLSLGFAAAIPVSWLQRRVRVRVARRRAARRDPGPPAP
jgi:signal peptidase I